MISQSMGRGKLELVSCRYEKDEHDFCKFRMTEPFSIPLCCGARAAGIEAILGYAHGVTCEETSPDVYTITVFPFKHPVEFAGRMLPEDYRHEPGGIELVMCSSCGGPRALSEYRWHQNRGVILNESTGQRMVLLAPHELDPVFQELEKELGETIPQIVVEAQRRITKTGFYSMGDISDLLNLRTQFALRGLGELCEFSFSKQGLNMRLENTVLHLMVTGIVQGLFEIANDRDSTVRWEFSGKGDLEVEVTAQD